MVTPVYQPIGTRAQEGLQNFLATQQAGQQANPEDILLERQYQGFLNQEKKSGLDKLTREGALREILSAIAGIEPILNSIPPNATPEQYQGPKQQMLDYLKQVSPQYSGTARQGLDAFALKIANNNFVGAKADIESAKAAAQAYFTTGQTGQVWEVSNVKLPNPNDNNRIWDGTKRVNKVTGEEVISWSNPNAEAQLAGEKEQAKNPALIDRTQGQENIKTGAYGERQGIKANTDLYVADAMVPIEVNKQQQVGDVRTTQEIEANKGKKIDDSKIKTLEDSASAASGAAALIADAEALKQIITEEINSGRVANAGRKIGEFFGQGSVAAGRFEALSGQSLLNKVAQMKGALSDKDREFLERQSPSLDNSFDKNLGIIQEQITIGKRVLASANSAREKLNSGDTNLNIINDPSSSGSSTGSIWD